MPSRRDLVSGVQTVMIKVWQLPPKTGEAEIEKYVFRRVERVDAGDTRYALDLQARDIQVNWLKLPLTNDFCEVVDWTLALVRNPDPVS